MIAALIWWLAGWAWCLLDVVARLFACVKFVRWLMPSWRRDESPRGRRSQAVEGTA